MFRNEDKGEGPNKRLLPPFVQYIEWLRLSCLSVFLFISGIYMPIIGLAVALMAPVPISLIGVRQGTYKAFLAVAFVAAMLFLPFGAAGAASFIFGAGFLGFVFALAVRKTNSAGEAIFGLIAAALISKLMFMGFTMYTDGINPFTLNENAVSSIMKSINASAASEDIFQKIAQQLSLMTPSFLIMASGLDALVTYFLVSKIESRRQKINAASSGAAAIEPIHPLPPFGQWSFPRSLLAAFFTAFFITLFDASGSSRILLSAEVNLKVLTSVMFFIQGLGFVWCWMLHRNFSHWARLAILFILLFIPVFSMGLIIIGIIDITVNLREKIRRVNK